MQADYALAYRELYERHWWWRARERLLLDTLRRYCPPDGWPRILDIGCGDGLFFDRLAEFGEAEGVEVDASLVSATGKHRSRIHIGPFDASFQPTKRYSLILMLDVLEHLRDPAGALRRALALLEPGGTFLATVPAFRALWTSHDVINQHYTRYTKPTFSALAQQAGLRIDIARYFFIWTCPAKLALRAVEGARRVKPGSPRVPASWLNSLLLALSRFEQETIGRLPVPCGSSLLVMGTRADGTSSVRDT